jgi:MYXO-CTERM domain-containing protein
MLGCNASHAGPVIDSLPEGHLDASAPPTSFSAPMMFALAITPTGISSVGGEMATCPIRTESGGTVVLEGGCTDDQGREWFGRAVTPSNALPGVPTNGTITYEGFGSDQGSDCADRPDARSRTLADGTVTFTQTAASLRYDIDVVLTVSGVQDDCTETERQVALLYSGSMTQDGNAQIWEGSGSVGNDLAGRFDVRTDGERLDDDACNTEALSGTTTVTAGSDVAVITYDGATDCDPMSTATWTLNGVDQGTVTGVRCSASPGQRGSPALAIVAVLGAAIVWGVRRRR